MSIPDHHVTVGNDIVDLALSRTQEKHRDARFLQRVFTQEEGGAIVNASFPDRMLWALWAAKESAFKAYQKVDSSLVFAHRKFAVSAETLSALLQCDFSVAGACVSGVLCYQEQHFSLRWEWSQEYVHAVAVFGATSDRPLYHRIDDLTSLGPEAAGQEEAAFSEQERAEIYGRPSESVRWQAKQLLAEVVNNVEGAGGGRPGPVEFVLLRPIVTMRGQERKGPVVIYRAGQPLAEYDISLSHDGDWVASVLLEGAR